MITFCALGFGVLHEAETPDLSSPMAMFAADTAGRVAGLGREVESRC